jgi:hypothetical protein
MAYLLMLPDGTTGTNQWAKSDLGETEEALVQSDDDDTSYIYEISQSHEITFTMANPSVSEAAIDFDEDVSVRLFMFAHYYQGSGTIATLLQITGTGISLAGDAVNIAVNSSYPSYAGTIFTNKSLGTAWDYAGLENIQARIDVTGRPIRFSQVRVSYIHVRVDYTEVTADNATFFGANF